MYTYVCESKYGSVSDSMKKVEKQIQIGEFFSDVKPTLKVLVFIIFIRAFYIMKMVDTAMDACRNNKHVLATFKLGILYSRLCLFVVNILFRQAFIAVWTILII